MQDKIKLFEKILQEYENDFTIKVTKLIKKPACSDGDNFSSTVSRVIVMGSRITESGYQIEYKTTLIVKALLLTEVLKNYFMIEKAFKNELQAIKYILPALRECAPRHELPIPDCLYADDELIILQDLSAVGYINIGRPAEITIEKCKHVLKVLAKFHASSIVLKQKDPEKLKSCIKPLTETLFPSAHSILSRLQKNHLQIAINILKETEPNNARDVIIEHLEQIKPTAFASQCNLLNKSWKISAITHGDVWVKNLLFSKTEAKLIDFQIIRYTTVAADLSHILYINLKSDVRRNNRIMLLKYYLHELLATLKETNADKDENITFEVLMEEMDAFKIFGFMSKLWILPVYYFKPTQMHGLGYSDVGVNITNMLSNVDDSYKKALLELVYDYVHDGKYL